LNEPIPLPHPEFGLANISAINLPKVWRDRRTADYLAHCIARNPRDLRAHARRIAVHHARGEDQDLAGAVIDLFIVLADKGASLKRLLLTRHADELQRTGCYPALAQAQDGALSPHATQIALPASIFCRPTQGNFDIVRDIRTDTEENELDEEEVRLQLIEELGKLGLTDEANELKAEL
jgi:hypothetical protein